MRSLCLRNSACKSIFQLEKEIKMKKGVNISCALHSHSLVCIYIEFQYAATAILLVTIQGTQK